MKHRALGGMVVERAAGALDAPTVELHRPGQRSLARSGALLVPGSLAIAAAGLLTAFAPLLTAAPGPMAATSSADSIDTPATVPTPAGLDLGVVGDIGMSPDPAAPTDGMPVPGGVVGLTTDGAMDRYRHAGFDNVRFLNTSGGTVLVPSDLFRVVSAPTAGTIADPDISLDVWATKILKVVTPAERAASDRAEAAWERRRQAEKACGLYRLDGPTSSDVADCIERRTR